MAATSDSSGIGESTVPFSSLPFSDLFRAYCADDPSAWSFFPNGSSLRDAESIALDSGLRRRVDRTLIVDVLGEQNASWGGDDAVRRNLELLARDDSVCAVTGQQLGLFVSPLYTIYKALSAVSLARSWRARGLNGVPVFWLADEDHDFHEVATTFMPCGDTLARVGLPVNDSRVPVGRRRLGEDVKVALEALAEALPVTPFRREVLDAVHDCYVPGETHRDAFARLLHRLLAGTGIVLMSADDRRFKQRVVDLFVRELTDDSLYRSLVSRTTEIESAFHAQIRPRDTNLFFVRDERTAIDRTIDGFRAGSNEWSMDELVAVTAEHAEWFSPNVALRPIVQDTLLPTAAYVAGPGELAYYAQLGPAYRWAGVEMPFIAPRASITLLDNPSQRLISELGIPLQELAADPDRLFAETVRRTMPEVLFGTFENAKKDLNETVDRLKSVAVGVEPTLDRTSEGARVRVLKAVDRLLTKVERAERRNQAELRQRISHLHDLVFPGGGLQERTLSPLYFAARYGMGFFGRLADRVPPDAREHHVILASTV